MMAFDHESLRYFTFHWMWKSNTNALPSLITVYEDISLYKENLVFKQTLNSKSGLCEILNTLIGF